MEGEYPRFKSSYFQEELVEGFHLGPDEFDFIFKPSRRCQSPRDRHPFEIIAASELFPGGFSSWIHRIPVGTPQRVADGRHLDLRSGLRRQDGEQQQAGGLP